MKLANIIPVFKKGARNYRPVSVLPVFSKIFEKLLQKQFLVFFSQYLIKFSVRFSKRGVWHAKLLIDDAWDSEKSHWQKKSIWSVANRPAKSIRQIKLYAYDLDKSSLNLLQDYLSNRKQRTKVDSFFNSWEDILFGVPQSSISGALLFNNFRCDMFLILKTVYFTGYVIRSLEHNGENLITWFSNN